MFKAQIEAGAKLLDEKFGPAWLRKQDLKKLDVGHACNCVVGQTYNTENNLEYWNMLEVLFPGENVIQQSYDHGFSVSGCDDKDLAQLTQEWKQFITDRRAQNATV